MKRFPAVALLLLFRTAAAFAQETAAPAAPSVPTPGEAQGWFAPTTPVQAADFLDALEATYTTVQVDTLTTVGGEPVARDSVLPVYLVRVGAGFQAEGTEGTEASGPVRVLVLAGQRGDEFGGFEVSLRMMRDLAGGALSGLLDQLEVAFVPAVNPWGLLWWVKEEPSGVDPARDHATLRSEAQRAVHEWTVRWRPDVVIELRDLGPEVYRIQAGLPMHPNVDTRLTQYARFYLLPYVANELAKVSITFREQVAVHPEPTERVPLVGGAASLPADGFLTPGPLGADRARNSFALGGSLGVMLGVASLEGPEGLGHRVELQYLALKALLEVTAGQGQGLRERTAGARRWPVDSAGDESGSLALALRAEYESDTRRPELTWSVWSEHGTVMRETTDRWRSVVRRLLALPVPAAWLIEPEATEWADLVRSHGFVVERLERSARVRVEAYPVGVPDRLPEGLTRDLPLDSAPDASALLVPAEREFGEGTWVVRSSQARARLLFTLLEPWSQDSPLSGDRRATAEDGAAADAGVGSEGPFLYPVYRIDGEALSGLRTEALHEDGSSRRESD